MIVSIGEEKLNELLTRQLGNNFLLDEDEKSSLDSLIPKSLTGTEICFSQILNKYYTTEDQETLFNPYQSAQYSIFLYLLSRQAFLDGNSGVADKIYCLNKLLGGLDIFYEVKLPEVFFLDHPVGAVIGRATIGNYFSFQQQCTVGSNHGTYPVLGENVKMFAGSIIIGNCKIGNNVFVSATTLIKDEDIPDNSLVFGKSPNLIIKHRPPEYFYANSHFRKHRELVK